MGRLSNAVSIRLGNRILWLNNGIYIRKINCIKYIHFINNIINLINIRAHKKNYLLSKLELFQEKSNLLINIYFYRKKINIFVIQRNKVNNNIKKINKFKNLFIKKKKKKKKIKLLKKKIKRIKKKKKIKLLKKKKIKIVLKRNFFRFYRRRRYRRLKYFSKKKYLKYFYKNRLLKFKLLKKKKKYIFLYNTIFNEVKKKKKKINYNFIIIYKRNISNILYNIIKKKLKYFKSKKKKLFKKKKRKFRRINRLLSKNIIKKKKIKKLKKLLLRLIIRNNNCKIDLLKVNKVLNYQGLTKYFRQPKILVIKKKLLLLYLRKKKKKVLKLLKFLILKKLIKNKRIKNIFIKKRLYIYNYYTKIININGIKYKKIYKYTFKKIIFYKYTNYKKFKNFKKINKLKYLFNQEFLLNLFLTEKLILLVGKNYLNNDIIFNYFLVGNHNYTSELLTTYICIKLKQRFTINQVMKPLTKYLKKLIKKKNLYGYRIKLSGRFTRKQRATSIVIKYGTVPLATIDRDIDYAQNDVILKDGVGSVKVWLNKTKKFKNYIISFKSV